MDEPLRRRTVSILQAGEERCGDQLIQKVVNRQIGGERQIWGAIHPVLCSSAFHGRAENEDGGGPLDRSAEEGESHEEPLRLGTEKIQELGQKNIIRGKVITASPVSSQTEDKMKALVQSRAQGTVEFNTEVDPSLIGGFILEYDTYRMDASVKSQLNAILTQLKK